MVKIFLPTQPDDPMVERLAALRDEAEVCGHELLTHLIELALMEAEKIAEIGHESIRPQPGPRGTP